MAERVEISEATVPLGTAIASAVTFTQSWLPGILRRIEIVVPPGPSGLVGFRFLNSGQTVIPRDASKWFVTDDEKLGFDIEGFPTSDKWSVRAYNLDIYDHTLYFRWFLDEIPSHVDAPLVPIAIE